MAKKHLLSRRSALLTTAAGALLLFAAVGGLPGASAGVSISGGTPSVSSQTKSMTGTGNVNDDVNGAPPDGIISLPLLSHHGLQQRRRRERRHVRELQVDGLGIGGVLGTDPASDLDSRHLKDNTSNPRPDQQLAALYQGLGTHYVDLWVGTPPQRQTVIVGK